MRNLLTVDEVAQYLKKPKSWVYNEWKSVGIPFKRIGTQLRCRQSDFDRWVDQQSA